MKLKLIKKVQRKLDLGKEFHIATMAKVGSTTFLRALQCNNQRALHYHSLHKLKRELNKNNNNIFVTGIRNFVDRNISYFFQTFTDEFVNDLGEYCFVSNKEDILQMSTSNLIDRFFDQNWHATPILWWDSYCALTQQNPNVRELESGFSVVSKDKKKFIIYRMEDMRTQNIRVPDELRVSEIRRENDSSEKWYKEKYIDFKSKISFPKTYLERLLYSNPMKNMYTYEEIDRFYHSYRVNSNWF